MTPDIAHSTSNSTPSPTPGWNQGESSATYRPRPRLEGSGPDWPSSWTLPRTEVAFEAAFEHSYNAMVITDADFDGGPFIRRCNPAFCAMTGYAEKELIGQSPRILQGPDTDRQLIDQLDRTIRAGEFFEGSTFNYRKDGGSYVVEWNISPVRDADGAIVAYISIQQDITVRFVAEQALEEARRQRARADERYRRSMDNAAVGMCLATPGGRFTDVNEALCHFFGYDAESLTQKTFQELTAPEYLEADLENANNVLAGRIDSFRMIKQYIHADGDLIWGDLSVSCLRDEHGQVENFIGQIIDITAAVEANERIHIGLLAADEARRQQARADERFRRSMQYAAIGMCLLAPDGREDVPRPVELRWRPVEHQAALT